MNAKMNVSQWKDLLIHMGWSEEDMAKWHSLFESKYPEGHQAFLEWLGLDEGRISEVRKG